MVESMNSFKKAALKILKQSKQPLHYKEITIRALKNKLIKTSGKTPWATMNSILLSDIKYVGRFSSFIKTTPGHFAYNPKVLLHADSKKIFDAGNKLSPFVSSKQKGDIAENRVAELITLYGEKGLSCYRPMTDDEGIDWIVKRRGRLDVVYIQVKSTYSYQKKRGFVAKVKEKTLQKKNRMLIVFVYFDLSDGDLIDYVFCIPVPKFLKLTNNKNKKAAIRIFTVGLKHPERSKYAEFMIEKRELADKIIEIMEKL